jgi:hypothetical protein
MTEGAPYTPGPLYTGDPSLRLWTTDPARQLHILLAHPSLFLTLPLVRFQSSMWLIWFAATFIGLLGTLTVILPPFLYAAWVWALGAACAADVIVDRAVPGTRRGVPEALTTVAVMLLTTWGILISLYLTWTKLGQAARRRANLAPLPAASLRSLKTYGQRKSESQLERQETTVTARMRQQVHGSKCQLGSRPMRQSLPPAPDWRCGRQSAAYPDPAWRRVRGKQQRTEPA